MQAFERPRIRALAQDELRTAAADIHYEAQPFIGRQAVRDAHVDKAGFLDTGDDFYRMAERLLGLAHEPGILARAPDRARTGRADAGSVHFAKPLAEQRQAVQCSCSGVRREIATFGQSLREADGFLDAVDNRELPVSQLADDHVKTVGAEVNRSDDLFHIAGCRNPGATLFACGSYCPGRNVDSLLCYTENDEPQPQVVWAFGLRMMNCAPCRSSL